MCTDQSFLLLFTMMNLIMQVSIQFFTSFDRNIAVPAKKYGYNLFPNLNCNKVAFWLLIFAHSLFYDVVNRNMFWRLVHWLRYMRFRMIVRNQGRQNTILWICFTLNFAMHIEWCDKSVVICKLSFDFVIA